MSQLQRIYVRKSSNQLCKPRVYPNADSNLDSKDSKKQQEIKRAGNLSTRETCFQDQTCAWSHWHSVPPRSTHHP